MRYAIAASDIHAGSTISLCPPTVTLDDGGTYRASRVQRELWECWIDFTGKVGKLPGDISERLLFLNGDIGELDSKDRSTQVITRNKATIMKIAMHILDPILDVVGGVVVTRGTPAHTGKASWLEETIAGDIDDVIHQDDKAASWWHFRKIIAGKRWDVSHHASMSRIPWSRAESANKIAARMTWLYTVRMREPTPDIALRSHNHIWGDSYDAYPVRVVCLPAWTPITEYGYRIGAENDLADIGGAIISCETLEVEKIKYRMKGRVWTSLTP